VRNPILTKVSERHNLRVKAICPVTVTLLRSSGEWSVAREEERTTETTEDTEKTAEEREE
jgi:hypothetical protein